MLTSQVKPRRVSGSCREKFYFGVIFNVLDEKELKQLD